MKNTFWEGHLGAMPVKARNSLLVWSAGLYAILIVVGIVVFDFSIPLALGGGLLGVMGHWLACVVHHYGHFRAAQMVGYPMRYVILWGLLGTDIYPRDEGSLPGAIHIRRAFGGPIASLLLSLASGVLAGILYFTVDEAAWFVYFLFLDALLVFTIGAFLPLKFIGIETDGDTLMKWWGKA